MYRLDFLLPAAQAPSQWLKAVSPRSLAVSVTVVAWWESLPAVVATVNAHWKTGEPAESCAGSPNFEQVSAWKAALAAPAPNVAVYAGCVGHHLTETAHVRSTRNVKVNPVLALTAPAQVRISFATSAS